MTGIETVHCLSVHPNFYCKECWQKLLYVQYNSPLPDPASELAAADPALDGLCDKLPDSARLALVRNFRKSNLGCRPVCKYDFRSSKSDSVSSYRIPKCSYPGPMNLFVPSAAQNSGTVRCTDDLKTDACMRWMAFLWSGQSLRVTVRRMLLCFRHYVYL